MQIEGASQQTSKSCRTSWGFLWITKVIKLLCLIIKKITCNEVPKDAQTKYDHQPNQTNRAKKPYYWLYPCFILLAMCYDDSTQMDHVQPTIKRLILELALIYIRIYNSKKNQPCFTSAAINQRHLEGNKTANTGQRMYRTARTIHKFN